VTELEDAFARLHGEQATEEQKKRLYEVRDALGLANNDSLWLILLALEHYDGRFRQYPHQLAAEALRVLEGQRAALAHTAAAETAKVQRSLARAVVATAEDLAGRRADAARWRAWALVAAGMVLFGALCATCGYALGAGRPPPWVFAGSSASVRVVGAILGAPAGWTVFALLAPLAVYYAWTGWTLWRSSEGEPGQRMAGLGMLAGAVTGMLTSAVVLTRVLLGR
jgi:hypothetical protein